MNDDFKIMIERIVEAVSDAGYDPYAQLTGYLHSSDERYITRNQNARAMIGQLDRRLLKQYLEAMEFANH